MSTPKTKIRYEYRNAPIPGGGYVTGFLFHPDKSDVLYARTDIGGTYRYNYPEKKWESLIDHVTVEDLSETYPIALALSEQNTLYIACGIYGRPEGTLCISKDRGKTFSYKKVPAMIHGNLSGRGTGYRLVVAPGTEDCLYFASQKGGLLRSCDGGDTWERLPIEEDYMTFVWVAPNGTTIVAGTAGYTTRESDDLRSHSLYISYDQGAHFEKLPMPESKTIEGSKMNGLVAHRYAFDGQYFYVTLEATGKTNYIVDLGYSCDTGDALDGRILRYAYEDGTLGCYEEITPCDEKHAPEGALPYGFGGIDCCQAQPGLLVASTLGRDRVDGDAVYRSTDYGRTWEVVLHGLEIGQMKFRTSYMLPEHNGGGNLIHWLSDVKLNPANPNEVWFNSGTGVFLTENFLAEEVCFSDHCDGIEETVHLNVYGPVDGPVKLLDIVGDLGGFAFRELDKPCKNSLADEKGNRYITCINADMSDENPLLGIVTARGNWTGKTKGGLIVTHDGFESVQRLPMPFGMGEKLDRYLRQIECPNVNPGWVAMSVDGNNLIWSIADGICLPKDLVICSQDGGKTFAQVKLPANSGLYFKAFSDRVDKQLFYGFDETGRIYVSLDGGASFEERFPVEGGYPKADYGKIDTANKTEIRGVAGSSGLFFIAVAHEGLWKMRYNKEEDTLSLHKLSKEGDSIYRIGLGIGRKKIFYGENNVALYVSASIDGEYGFYRSFDELETVERINTKQQMYGEINSIDGDKRTFGRFFLATGSRGVLYGIEGGTDTWQ